MSTESGFAYLRTVDFESLKAAADSGELAMQAIIARDSGASTCLVNAIMTAPGQGSPAGLHTHRFDKVMFVEEGTVSVQIEDDLFEAHAGDFVVIPAGVSHRNWNATSEYVKFISFITPVPDPDRPLADPA